MNISDVNQPEKEVSIDYPTYASGNRLLLFLSIGDILMNPFFFGKCQKQNWNEALSFDTDLSVVDVFT